HRGNFRGGSRAGGGRGGGRRGGRGGGEQRWWDPQWRAERLRQIASEKAAEIEVMDRNEWLGKLQEMKRGVEQELVIKRKFNRDDTQALSDMANQLGLYFQSYNKGGALVVSKLPLPDYRADLDERHGMMKKEITMSTDIEKRVGSFLSSSVGNSVSRPFSVSLASSSKTSEVGRATPISNTTVVSNLMDVELKQRQEKTRESESMKDLLAFRDKLPAFKQKSEFLKAVETNRVLVVSGETGCGKTTQLPQFILEEAISSLRGSSCSIICTQPRRISAISVAARVSAERGEKLGETVGYQIHLESKQSAETRLLFCTTGLLLRRLIVDPNLIGVSHLVVDEIHERGLNEDFLLIIMKDLLQRRSDIRLILMSATINAELFSQYFGDAPTIHIPGFTFPVKEVYLEDVLEKTQYRIGSRESDSGKSFRRGQRQEEAKDPLIKVFE
ncbi:hypothetical protein M569_05701, partial [Genlisea aurea]